MRENGKGGVRLDMDSMLDTWSKTLEKERRERIATACLQGLLANSSFNQLQRPYFVEEAIEYADKLIEELDK